MFPRRKKRCAHSGFTVRKTVVLSVFEGWKKKNVSTVIKRYFHTGFTVTKTWCFNSGKKGV